MDIPNVEKILDEFVSEMFSQWKTFQGNSASDGMKRLVSKEVNEVSAKAVAPYWFPVFQYGRGVRKTNSTEWVEIAGVPMSTFQRAIYEWMTKKSLFTSKTERGRLNEAKGLAWYINKYGNAHFRSGKFIDVYEGLIKKYAQKFTQMNADWAIKMTSELMKF